MTIPKYNFVHIGQVALITLAALLGVLVVTSLASGWGDPAKLAALVEQYTDSGKTPPDSEATSKPAKQKGNDKKNKTKSPLGEQVDRICKRYFFAPEPKKSFSATLTGLLGEEAFFDGQAKGYKVGQSYKNAKIKAIGGDWVEVVFESKARKLHVFGPGSSPGPSPSMGPRSLAGSPQMSRCLPGGDKGSRMMPPGFKLTPEKILEFKKMSPEKRSRALEQMPAELRKQLQ